jgi:hypothetical protein
LEDGGWTRFDPLDRDDFTALNLPSSLQPVLFGSDLFDAVPRVNGFSTNMTENRKLWMQNFKLLEVSLQRVAIITYIAENKSGIYTTRDAQLKTQLRCKTYIGWLLKSPSLVGIRSEASACRSSASSRSSSTEGVGFARYAMVCAHQSNPAGPAG